MLQDQVYLYGMLHIKDVMQLMVLWLLSPIIWIEEHQGIIALLVIVLAVVNFFLNWRILMADVR